METTIGERLKLLRLQKGLKQKDIEELTGIDHTTISAYELGKRKPSIENLKTLARLYKVTTDYILGNSHRRFVDTTNVDEIGYKKILAILEEYDVNNL